MPEITKDVRERLERLGIAVTPELLRAPWSARTVAQIAGITEKTLSIQRKHDVTHRSKRKLGPPFWHIGRRYVYPPAGVLDYLGEHSDGRLLPESPPQGSDNYMAQLVNIKDAGKLVLRSRGARRQRLMLARWAAVLPLLRKYVVQEASVPLARPRSRPQCHRLRRQLGITAAEHQHGLLTSSEVAQLLELDKSTPRQWRQTWASDAKVGRGSGVGPPFISIGGEYVYSIGDLALWVAVWRWRLRHHETWLPQDHADQVEPLKMPGSEYARVVGPKYPPHGPDVTGLDTAWKRLETLWLIRLPKTTAWERSGAYSSIENRKVVEILRRL